MKIFKSIILFLLITSYTQAQKRHYFSFEFGTFAVSPANFEDKFMFGSALTFELNPWLEIATNFRLRSASWDSRDYNQQTRLPESDIDVINTIPTLSISPIFFLGVQGETGLYISPKFGRAFQRTRAYWQKIDNLIGVPDDFNEGNSPRGIIYIPWRQPTARLETTERENYYYYGIEVGIKGHADKKKTISMNMGLHLDFIDLRRTMQNISFENGYDLNYHSSRTGYFLGWHLKVGGLLFRKKK